MQFAIKVITLVLFLVGSAHGDQLEAQGKALNEIRNTADSLCKDIPLEQDGTEVELDGKAKGELDGMIAKLIDLRVEGAAKVKDSQSKGILQRDLVHALKTSTDCKLEVFKTLQEKLLPPSGALDTERRALLSSLNARLEAIGTTLNRIRHGGPAPEGFFGAPGRAGVRELVPLTAVFEDIAAARPKLMETDYEVLLEKAQLVLRLARVRSDEDLRRIAFDLEQISERIAKASRAR